MSDILRKKSREHSNENIKGSVAPGDDYATIWEDTNVLRGDYKVLEDLAKEFCNPGKVDDLNPEYNFIEDGHVIELFVYRDIKSLPNSISNLKNLRKLTLVDTDLTELPESIGQLENLEEIHVNGNKRLEYLPKEMFNAESLRHINVSHNLLKEIPEQVGDMELLESFRARYNDLESLPTELYGLESLSVLGAEYNKIQEISGSVGGSNLEKLYLQGNRISKIPSEIYNALDNRSLWYIDVSENTLSFWDKRKIKKHGSKINTVVYV